MKETDLVIKRSSRNTIEVSTEQLYWRISQPCNLQSKIFLPFYLLSLIFGEYLAQNVEPTTFWWYISLFCWLQIIQWWISWLSLHFSFSQRFYGFCWGRFFATCRTLGKNHNKWLSWYTHEYNWYHNIKLHCSGVVFVVIKDSSFLQ